MSCLTPERIDDYLDRRLDSAARAEVENHLSRCSTCRRRLVERSDHRRPPPEDLPVPEDLQRRARQVARRRSPPAASAADSKGRRSDGISYRGGLIAATVLLVAAFGVTVWNPGPGTPGPSPDTLRSGPADPSSKAPVELLHPADGAVVDVDPVVLRWAPVPGARHFSVTVTDELGTILHQGKTQEPRLSLAAREMTPPLTTETLCFWYVEASLVDGTAVESAVSRWTWQPP